MVNLGISPFWIPPRMYYSDTVEQVLDRYTNLQPGRVGAIAELINTLDADGNLATIDELFLLNNGDLNSVIGINGTIGILNGTANPTFDDGGMLTDGVDNYLDTTIVPSTDLTQASLDDMDVQCFVTDNLDAGNVKMIYGTEDGTNSLVNWQATGADRIIFTVNTIGAVAAILAGNIFQDETLYGINRIANTDQQLYIDGVQAHTEADASNGLCAVPIFLGAVNISGVDTFHINAKFGILKIGAGIGFNSSAFNTAIRTYLTSTGTI